jgi:uncharacterized protein YndB with AHSA1/START domain
VDPGRCSLRLTRRYAASAAEVWGALTEPESVRRWFGSSHDGLPGRVQISRPFDLLELVWESHGDASVVRFELTEDERGTVLVLDHSLIEESAGMAYVRRWTEALDRLDGEVER